jgi:hypothetical protein
VLVLYIAYSSVDKTAFHKSKTQNEEKFSSNSFCRVGLSLGILIYLYDLVT